MILEFEGNAPRSKYIRIGVIGNNLVDELVFIIGRRQGRVDLSEYLPKIKITTSEGNFAEYSGESLETQAVGDDFIKVTYIFPEIVTQQRNINTQLVFERSEGGDARLWQTLPFNVTFSNSINESDAVIEAYPNIIRELQAGTQKAIEDANAAVSAAAGITSSENERVTAEEERKAAESERTVNELEREQAERERDLSEGERKDAESARELSEKEREEKINKLQSQVTELSQTAENTAQELDALTQSVSELSQTVDSSTQTLTEKDTELQSRITVLGQNVSALTQTVDNSTQTLNAKDADLQSQITAETTAREAQDNNLLAVMAQHVQNLSAVDSQLSAAIGNEQNARVNKDNDLQSRITALGQNVSEVTQSVYELSQTVDSTTQTLNAKDADLQSQITSETTARCDGIQRVIAPFNEMIVCSKGLQFTSSGTECYLSGLGTCTDAEVIIPEEHGGQAVTFIGIGALAQNSSALKTLVIPPSIIRISQMAFTGASNLKTVIFRSETPPNIQNASEFAALDAVFVPQSALSAYKSVLSNHADKVKAIDFPYTIGAVISDIYARLEELKALLQ